MMKKRGQLMAAQFTAIALSLVMAFTVFPLSASAAAGDGTDGASAAEAAAAWDFVPGQLIVVTENDVSKKQMKSIVKGVDGQVDTISSLGDDSKMALIEVEEGSELSVAAELETEDKVLYVQPNYIYEFEEDELSEELTENEPEAEKAEEEAAEEQAENEPAKELIKDESAEPEDVVEPETKDEVQFPDDVLYRGTQSKEEEQHYGGKYAGQKRYLAPVGDGGEAGTVNAKGAWDQLELLDNQPTNSGEKKKPVVAVIDTGANISHEDMAGAILKDKCVTFNEGEQKGFKGGDNSLDDDGHGTRVTGIICANLNNEIGIAGIAGNRVKMIIIDTSMPKEKPSDQPVSHSIDIAKGIHYAIDNGADLISISIGFYCKDYFLESAVKNAWDNGTLCVCSAGNGTTNHIHYPGDSPYAITVMSHGLDGKSLGASDYGFERDISAIGDYIHSTRVNGYCVRFEGTSAATPVVTGAAALLLYANPELTPRQIKNLLYTSTGSRSFSPDQGGQGFGRINIGTAMNNLLADNIDPNEIIINKTSITMRQGTDTSIEYAVYPGNTNTTNVTFASSNEDIVEVDADGIVTAKAPGSATIDVTCGNLSAQCEVTVNEISQKTIGQIPYRTEDCFDLTESIDYIDEVNEAGTVINRHGYYYHQYLVDLEENETIRAIMSGTDFYPYLRVIDNKGSIVATGVWNEDKTYSIVTYKAKKAGTYKIQAMRVSSKGRLGTNYDLKIASDKAFCKPEIKSIGDGQMTMSWPAVENANYYLVKKYAKYADIVQGKPEVEEKITETEYTDTAYDKSKANFYTVTACMNTNAGDFYNGETPLFIKLKNPMTVKGKTVKVKRKKVRRKNVSLSRAKVMTVSNAKGTVTYTKASGNKKITIAKSTGAVKIKKGLKKGKYTVKVKVYSSGNENYKATTKTVTFKIRVR